MKTRRKRDKVKSRTLFCVIAMMLLTALTFPVLLGAQEQQEQHQQKHTRYRVKDLGTLGGTFSFAGGINEKGEVAGYSSLAGDEINHAFLWRRRHMVDLGTLGGPNSFADFRPNNNGVVGGSAEISTADPLGEDFCGFGTHLICPAVVWWKGVVIPLPRLGGDNGHAAGVNDRGEIVGLAENTTPDSTCQAPQVVEVKPVIWKKGRVRELPTFAGDPDGAAYAINDRGQVAGYSGDCATPFHALLWQDHKVIDLGNLGGSASNLPFDLNNRGQVVGVSDLSGDTTFHAFLWKNGVMSDLGTLPGDVNSYAAGINSKGQVVGGSQDADGNFRAFLWQDGVMTDLNTLIPADSPLVLLEATGSINSRGQIAGLAMVKSTGEVHAFLATPREVERDDEGSASLATLSVTSESQKVSVHENVRKMLQERLTPGRFRGRSTKRQ